MKSTTYQGVRRIIGWLLCAASLTHAMSVRGNSRTPPLCSLYKPEAQASVYDEKNSLACASGLVYSVLTFRHETETDAQFEDALAEPVAHSTKVNHRLNKRRVDSTFRDALLLLKEQWVLLSQKMGPPGGHRKKRKNRNAWNQTIYRLEYCAIQRILRGKKIAPIDRLRCELIGPGEQGLFASAMTKIAERMARYYGRRASPNLHVAIPIKICIILSLIIDYTH